MTVVIFLLYFHLLFFFFVLLLTMFISLFYGPQVRSSKQSWRFLIYYGHYCPIFLNSYFMVIGSVSLLLLCKEREREREISSLNQQKKLIFQISPSIACLKNSVFTIAFLREHEPIYPITKTASNSVILKAWNSIIFVVLSILQLL